MLARDAAEGLSESLRAVFTGLGEGLSIAGKFLKDTTLASYNVAGQATFPIEQEQPHTFKELHPLGVAALTLPIVIPTMALSVTVIPIVGNSVGSAPKAFVSLLNALLHPDEQINASGISADPRSLLRQVYGVPGLLLGTVAALPPAALIASGRIITNSAKTAGRAFISVFRLSLLENERPFIDNIEGLNQNDSRSWFRQYIVGLPGLVLGSGLGLVAATIVSINRIISNNIKTGARAFISVFRLGLFDNEWLSMQNAPGLGQDDARHWFRQYVISLPGLILGSGLGLVAVALTSIGRMISNSINTGIRAYISTLKFFLTAKDAGKITTYGLNDHDEGRSWLQQYVLGLPGFLIGGGLGFVAGICANIGSIIKNTLLTAIRTFISCVKFSLHAEEKNNIPVKGLEENDTRHWFRRYGLGLPGLIIGGSLGLLAAISIGVGRLITNNLKTGYRAFISALKLSLTDEGKKKVTIPGLEENDEKRHWSRRYIVGFPGFLIGGGLGMIAAAIVGIGRVIAHNFRYGKKAVLFFSQLCLHEDERKLLDYEAVTPSGALEYLAGAPGLIIGGGFGLVSAVFISAGRMVTNSFKTGERTIISGFRSLYGYKLAGFNGLGQQDEKRSWARQYFVGSPGLIIGAGLSLLAAPFVILARVIKHSAKTAASTFMDIVRFAWYGKILDKDQKNTDQRSRFQKYITGLPGLVIGTALALPITVIIGVGHLLTHSIKTGAHAFTSAYHFDIPSHQPMADGVENKDERHWVKKYVLGFPGWVLGSAIGILSNIIANSFLSFYRPWALITNVALHPADKIKKGLQDNDPRSLFHQYVLGFPGMVLGGSLGIITAIGISVGRIISNNLRTFGQAFISACNLALSPDKKRSGGLSTDDQRDWFRKYVVGFPGLIAGGIMGLCFSFLKHSVHSCCALAGSLLNGAFERPLCEGLGGDLRTSKQKIIGSLGYVVAGSVIGPLFLVTLTLRKLLPNLLAGCLGIATGIAIVGPIKLIARGFSSRVKKNTKSLVASEQDIIEQGFKSLYSSLNAFGKFNPGSRILGHGDGEDRWPSFIRKCFTFNGRSLTERTIDTLLKHYRHSAMAPEIRANFFTTSLAEFNQAIEEVRSYYANDIFASQAEIEESKMQIDGVAELVRIHIITCLRSEPGQVQAAQVKSTIYGDKNKNAFWLTFWGGSRAPRNNGQEYQPAPQSDFAPA